MFFLDETGRRIGADVFEDSDGMLLLGEDDDGMWCGTERAALQIEPNATSVYVVNGYIAAMPFIGYYAAPSPESALTFAHKNHCVRDASVSEFV